MRLKGLFPVGIAGCKSMTGLDISSNELYGTIPSNISKILEFVTNLDLSSNNLSGEIPTNPAYCSYLNVLKLDNNQFSGPIPPEFTLLGRIKSFTVANNRLTGQIPQFNSNTTIRASSYSGNPGLCGGPLSPCRASSKKSHTGNPSTHDLLWPLRRDVYSFGVVLLGLVTGERPTHVSKAPESCKGSLVEWIIELSRYSKLQEAIDKPLIGKGYDIELFQFLKVAYSCVSPGTKERPPMFEVYQLLRPPMFEIGTCER